MCPKTEVGGKKGHAVHKTMCFNKILMIAATKYGYQPGQRLGWAALAYHKQEGANPDPGPRKHCLQNDGKPDEWLGVRVGTWNIRWRGQGARFLGVKGRRYKWWCGNSDGVGIVMVQEVWQFW